MDEWDKGRIGGTRKEEKERNKKGQKGKIVFFSF